MALHYFLTHATGLGADSVLSIAHLLDTVARQITVGASGISHRHGEVALLVTLQAHLCPVLGMVGHVVLRVGCRSVGLGVGIDTEHREVAGLAWPHPVVGLATKLTHRLGHGEHQSEVGEVLIGSGVEPVAFIERLYFHVVCRVLCHGAQVEALLKVLDQHFLLICRQLVVSVAEDTVGDVLLADHEGYEHVLVGQLLLVALGVETVEHVVVVNGGVGADGFKTAVMIGEDQSVGTHHDSRAIAGEVDHGAADGVAALIEVSVGQGETFLLHGVVDRLWQVEQRPHAFVGHCRCGEECRRE